MNNEQMHKALDSLLNNERHHTNEETRFWCEQYKQFAQILLGKLTNHHLPLSPEHLPRYIATKNVKPSSRNDGGGGGGNDTKPKQKPFAYFYHDAPHAELANPIAHSTLLVVALNRRPDYLNETPLYLEPLPSDYHEGWEEGFKAGKLYVTLIDEGKTWKGLTETEVLDALQKADATAVRVPYGLRDFAMHLEAKLKEKNT